MDAEPWQNTDSLNANVVAAQVKINEEEEVKPNVVAQEKDSNGKGAVEDGEVTKEGISMEKEDSSNGVASVLELASPKTAAAVAAALGTMPAATQKKFTSLNVNRRFLEKASPTIPAATIPVANKVNSVQPSSRLSTINPASRLTSAKLSTSVKSQPAGWGQVTPALSPGIASPNGDPLSFNTGLVSTISTASVGSSSSASKPGIVTSAPVAASPKLVTALTSGSVNRSTSPQNKGSPGLRNAALAASGRSSAPSVTAPPISSSSKAPWAKVKADTAPKSALATDFPTAAEAIKAKQEAERREKAAAAEAAAKAEQALQQLERYRGTSLGTGNHWDEMDDEDDLDEVVQFGDGTQYKVPVKKDEDGEPVSKEERFKDVGHDRSWPPRAPDVSSPTRPAMVTQSSSSREQVNSNSQDAPPPSRLFSSRANNKLEIRGGESISLDAGGRDRSYPQREGRSSFRNKERDGEGHGAGPAAAPAAPALTSAPARAWGPLAQRHVSLNPDAPKPAVVSPPIVSASLSAQVVTAPSTSTASPQATLSKSPPQQSLRAPPPSLQTPRPAANPSNTTKSTVSERALPPHLAANFSTPAIKTSAVSGPRAWDKAEQSAEESSQSASYGQRAAQSMEATPSSLQTPPASIRDEVVPPKMVAATGDSQREEMHSAAERARKRRQEEEERRTAEKVRAKAKAAAIEEKIRIAREEEENKKRLEQEAQQEKIRLQEKLKAEEAKHREVAAREQRERWSPRIQRPETINVQDQIANSNTANRNVNQQQKATNLLSPSDEAISWRRGKVASTPAPAVGPPGLASEGVNDQHAFKDVRPMPVETPMPQLKLLQRAAPTPSSSSREDAQSMSKKVVSNNEQDLASSTGMEGWDVVINRIKDSIPSLSSATDVRIPTGPRAGIKSDSKGAIQAQVKLPGKAPRVEIIAPTDEGAARHREAEQKQKQARQGQSSAPVSVLKSPNNKPIVMGKPEGPVTRSEVIFDSPPVWNRFKIKVGSSSAPRRLPRHLAKAQAMRIANSKNEAAMPRPVNILTWEPPILNLSSRTLSRDDQFFPKKYRKGVVITNVSIPTTKLERKPRGKARNVMAGEMMTPIVKVPASRGLAAATASAASGRELTDRASKEAQWRTNTVRSSANTTLDIPKAPASMRAKSSDLSDDLVATVTLPTRSSARNSGSVVAFAPSLGAREDSTPSPVSFMVTSELNKVEEPNVSLPVSTPTLSKAASASMLPSPNQVASTWGQNSLTFAGLDSEPNRVIAGQDHIKNVWALPSGETGKELIPTQNSLRGIVDEFPSSMTLSMQDLKADEGTAAQYHDVGVNTTKVKANEMTPSNHGSYSSLTGGNDKTESSTNGFQSPSTSKSSPQMKMMSANGGSSMAKSTSRSPSLGVPQAYQQDHRIGNRSVSAGFSPYAYPSPIQDYPTEQTALYNGHQRGYGHQQHRYNQPTAPMMDGGYSRSSNNNHNTSSQQSSVNAYGPYRGNPLSSPSMTAAMSTSTAGWPIDNPGKTNYAYAPPHFAMQNPSQSHQSQMTSQGSYNMMMSGGGTSQQTPPHHQRISSSNSRFQNSSSSSSSAGSMRGGGGGGGIGQMNSHNPRQGAPSSASGAGLSMMHAEAKPFSQHNNSAQQHTGQQQQQQQSPESHSHGSNDGGGIGNTMRHSTYRPYDSTSAVW